MRHHALIFLLSIVAITCTVNLGCGPERPTHTFQAPAAWTHSPSHADAVKTLEGDADYEFKGGGKNLLRWAPNGEILAWVERPKNRGGLDPGDALVLQWLASNRVERLALDTGNIVTVAWGQDSKRLVLGLHRSPKGDVAELVVNPNRIHLKPVAIPTLPHPWRPRNPLYYPDEDHILYLFSGDGIGLYDRKRGTVQKREPGDYFVNRTVRLGDGIARAEVGMTLGLPDRFTYHKQPISGFSGPVQLAESASKPFLLYAPYGSPDKAVFVVYRNQERDAGVVYSYDSTRHSVQLHVDPGALFAARYDIRAIAASRRLDYVAFSVDSDTAAACGVWIASRAHGELRRLTAYRGGLVDVAPDGTHIAYQDTATTICVAKVSAVFNSGA